MDQVKIFLVHMDIPIIDGLHDERMKLAELQEKNAHLAAELTKALSMEVGKLGFSIVSNGLNMQLVPMPLEVYVKSLQAIKAEEEKTAKIIQHVQSSQDQLTAQPEQAPGSGVSK